jgi:hypothetical protein
MKKSCIIILLAVIGLKVNAQWQRTNYSYGGEINCITISGNYVFAGSTDLYLSSDSGNSWTNITHMGYSGDRVVSALITSGDSIFAGCDQGIYSLKYNGSNWNAVDSFKTLGPVYRLAISGDTIFAGLDGDVFMSPNSGGTWVDMNIGSPDVYTEALAISGNTIFAGSEMGVLIYTKSGSSWNYVNLALNDYNVTCLSIKGNNIFAGMGDNGVYTSLVNGSVWSAVNTGLTDTIVNALAINGNNIYAGTQGGGVFLSSNNGGNWVAVNEGLTDTLIYSLATCGNYIYAGTIDGEIWKRPLSELTGIKDIINNASNIAIYPNPTSNTITIDNPGIVRLAVIEITNIQGQLVKSLATTGNKTNIDVSALPEGVYLVKLVSEKGVEVRKFLKEQ